MSGAARPLSADPDYARLKQRIIGHTGLAYFADKDDALAERLERRLLARGIAGCGGYLALLEGERFQGPEMDALAEQLTIGETFFFRYAEQFQALRQRVIPQAIAARADSRRLRIWSAGCSMGAEAYSVAAVVRELLGHRLADWQVTIIGTDINQAFLAHARRGLFNDWALRDVSAADRAGLFEPVGSHWRVHPALRAMVAFHQHNLMSLAPHPAQGELLRDFDIILCRNVMIYFDTAVLDRLLPSLATRLVEGGWLLVGHAEAGTPFERDFETVLVPGATLYRRPAASRPMPAPATRHLAARTTTPAILPAGPRTWPARPARVASPSPTAAAHAAGDGAAGDGAAGDDDWPRAEERYRRQVAATPGDPLAHYHLALVLEHREAAQAEAEQTLRKAVYLERGFAMAHFQLGTILQRRGDRDGAVRAFANALHGLSALGDEMPVPAGGDLQAGALRQLLSARIGALRASLRQSSP